MLLLAAVDLRSLFTVKLGLYYIFSVVVKMEEGGGMIRERDNSAHFAIDCGKISHYNDWDIRALERKTVYSFI